MIQSWTWGILAAGICLVGIITAITIWIIKRKKRMASNDVEKNNEQIIIPSESPTTIEDESIVTENNNKEATLYGQQFAVVETSQTVLSPPPRERKESNNSITFSQQDVTPQKIRDVFSLSPHPEVDSTGTPNSITSSRRTVTPFGGYTNNNTAAPSWRGPTPPWTHNTSPHQSITNRQ